MKRQGQEFGSHAVKMTKGQFIAWIGQSLPLNYWHLHDVSPFHPLKPGINCPTYKGLMCMCFGFGVFLKREKRVELCTGVHTEWKDSM